MEEIQKRQRFPAGTVLEALREGPVDAGNWARLTSSQKSLHVQIKNLRDRGFEIETVAGEAAGDRLGKPPCTYVLKHDPETVKEEEDA